MKLKQKREREVKLRKNFFPTLLVIVVFWLTLGSIIYFVDPESFGAIPLFFLILLFALLFTTSTLFANTRRGLTITIAIILFLILRSFGVGNIINFLLIFGLAIVFEIFYQKK